MRLELRSFLVPVCVVAMLSASCGPREDATGRDTTDTPAVTPGRQGPGHDGEQRFDPGQGDAADPDRTVMVTAQQMSFQPGELRVASGSALQVTLRNMDEVRHGLAIQQEGRAENVAELEPFAGPNQDQTLDVPALEVGTYRFHCPVHPEQMRGTLEVEQRPAP